MKKILSINDLDRYKCPICGHEVTCQYPFDLGADQLITVGITWNCTNCGTEFQAELFRDGKGTIHIKRKAVTFEPRTTILHSMTKER